jgi:S1-C subfamily serine protease
MIVHEGPKKKEQFKENITILLNKYRGFFLILLIGLPLLAFMPFKFNFISSGLTKGDNIEAVALIFVPSGTGTAFLVGTTKLVTARHVVAGISEGDIIKIAFEKSSNHTLAEAKLLFKPKDDTKDYAVLELTTPANDITPLNLGDGRDIQINDEVDVIGYPNSLFSSAKAQVTNNELAESPILFQMNGGAWPGNSGGPVINKKTNEVVGILIAGFQGQFQGMVYAIKINALLDDMEFKLRKIDLNR